MTRRLGWAALAVAALFLATPIARAQETGRFVLLVEQTGTVDPLTANYVERSIDDAARRGAAAVVIRIDTPGGLDSSMRKTIQAIQRSEVPVICWVGPPGARAASAGAFILIGCPFAAMAPGTNVGAAHPVGVTGDVMDHKVTNDASAYIRSLAQQWGRNANWAERAVRDSVSVSADEAKKLEVIDLVVPSMSELLRQTDGVTVKVNNGRTATMRTAGLPVSTARLNAGEALLHTLIDPNIAFLLFVFGIAGIVYEVLHPGLNVAGVVGLLMLIASFVILGMLPVNVAGLILIAAAIGFFVIDLKVTGHGLPTVAGITSLTLGGLFLFNARVPGAHVSRGLVVGVAITLAAVFYFVVRAAVGVRKIAPGAGAETIIGSLGTVTTALDPVGIVHVRSEHWTAKTQEGTIPVGAGVRVVAVQGLTLEVEPAEAWSEPRPTEEGVR